MVARKYSRYTIAEKMRAGIRVAGRSWTFDPVTGYGNYKEYAGPVYQYGRGNCVQYHGYYHNGSDDASHTSPTGQFCG